MNTTSLLVDILIIGFQVLTWMLGFLFSFIFPFRFFLTEVEKSPTILISVSIVVAYTLGIIFDYVIAAFFERFKSKEAKEAYQDGLVIRILLFNLEAQKFLDNQYARLRIARASIFNLPLITLAACSFIFNNNLKHNLTLGQTVFIVLVIGIVLTVLAIIGWKKRDKVYWGYIKETRNALNARNELPNKD